MPPLAMAATSAPSCSGVIEMLFAEGAHAAHAAQLLRQCLVRIHAKLLAGDVVTGQFAQAKLVA